MDITLLKPQPEPLPQLLLLLLGLCAVTVIVLALLDRRMRARQKNVTATTLTAVAVIAGVTIIPSLVAVPMVATGVQQAAATKVTEMNAVRLIDAAHATYGIRLDTNAAKSMVRHVAADHTRQVYGVGYYTDSDAYTTEDTSIMAAQLYQVNNTWLLIDPATKVELPRLGSGTGIDDGNGNPGAGV